MLSSLLVAVDDVAVDPDLLQAYAEYRRKYPQARGQHFHQLRLEAIEQKGTMVGRWIWATSCVLPFSEVLKRYGVLSLKLGPGLFSGKS